MAKSSREEFIEAPKREFTRASAEEVLLDGSSSGGAGTGGPNIEGRSPLENFENMIPAAPSTESDLAVHELVEALSVILIFQWLPAEKGVKQSGESRFERRSERLNLAYEFKEGSNTYEWKYDSFMVYDGSGRFVDATVALSHSAEAFDPRIQNLMGTPGTTRPDIALERAFARIQLLDEARKSAQVCNGYRISL
ncbi:MAG: hypothetical protein EG828_11445 [Deltaproteobacteria bacterium]|nr:hypothetical protein [Deltaproteobacteria bacterium]